MIRLGVCSDLRNAALVAQAGFDYIEGGLSGLAKMDEATYQDVKASLLQSPIRAEACNVMIPAEIPVVGPLVDEGKIRAYLTGVLPRASELGCKAIVFGSGGARRVPEGFPRDKAYEQIVAYLRLAGDMCQALGITIAIEPLNAAECNILTSVAEGAMVADRAAHPAVKVLADLYHIVKDGQSLDEIRAAGARMAHTHVAFPPTRAWPAPGDGYDYGAFFRALKDVGYQGRMSIEGKPSDDLAQSLKDGFAVLKPLA